LLLLHRYGGEGEGGAEERKGRRGSKVRKEGK
jgi:hypothetical protein